MRFALRWWWLLGILSLCQRSPAFAAPSLLANPNVISIEQVRRYTDVSAVGDALFIVHYNLEYTVPPTESITEGWIGRVLDIGGTGQLASVAPQAHQLIPARGYDHGIYSFYFATAPVATGTLTITLEGNPGLTPTPTGITTASIENRTASDLVSDMRLLGLHLGAVWPADVITFIGGVARFTSAGEEYFLAAIPNLVQYAPTLFTLGFIQPSPENHVDTPDPTYQTARDSFWAGTPVRNFTIAWGAYIGLPRTIFETIIVLILAVVIGGLVYKKTQQQEIGLFVMIFFQFVAGATGLGSWALLYTVAFIATFALAYLMFFRPAAG